MDILRLYVVLLFGCSRRNIVHMKFILTMFFYEHTTHLVESLLQEQRRGLNSEAIHCCHCKFEINKFYRFIILSTFLRFHICVLCWIGIFPLCLLTYYFGAHWDSEKLQVCPFILLLSV